MYVGQLWSDLKLCMCAYSAACTQAQLAFSLSFFFFYADHRVVNSYEEDQSLHSWLAWCSPDINRNPVVQLRERNEQRRKDKRQAECGGKTKRECVEAWGI